VRAVQQRHLPICIAQTVTVGVSPIILTRAFSSSGALSPIDFTLLKEEHLLISRGITKNQQLNVKMYTYQGGRL
jgi:hypothetical protein